MQISACPFAHCSPHTRVHICVFSLDSIWFNGSIAAPNYIILIFTCDLILIQRGNFVWIRCIPSHTSATPFEEYCLKWDTTTEEQRMPSNLSEIQRANSQKYKTQELQQNKIYMFRKRKAKKSKWYSIINVFVDTVY